MTNRDVPCPNSDRVVPGRLLAGEHPADFDNDPTVVKLSAVLDAGLRTIVDLTEPRETGS
jgi:hypothetical protein